MTDTAPQAPPAPPAAAPLAPPPAEAPPAPPAAPGGIDLAALARELAPLLTGSSAAAPAAPAAPEVPPAPENLFEKGQVVSYTFTTPYDGKVTRRGIVVETYPDEGSGACSSVAWFDHVSGPIGDNELEAG